MNPSDLQTARSLWANRIYNWKFASAHACIQKDPQWFSVAECRITEALANLLADVGWFDGHLGALAEACVAMLLEGQGYE